MCVAGGAAIFDVTKMMIYTNYTEPELDHLDLCI